MKPNRTNNLFTWRAWMVFALVCAGIWDASAQSIISFTINSTANANRNFMYPADLAGAPGVRTNNWNNIGQNVNGNSTTADAALPPGTITNSSGVLVPDMGALWHTAAGGAIADRGAGSTNDLKMFMDVADGYPEGTLAGYGYLNITNIPFTNYNVYVYFLPDNGNGSTATRGGVFCITNTPTGTNCVYMKNQSNDVSSTQLPVPNTSTFASAYVQSTTTTIGSGGVAWSTIQGGNYGVFYGLTNSECKILYAGLGNGSAAKDPFGNYVNGGSTAVRFKVAGFQIYQIPAATPTNLYLQNPTINLHAGDPSGTQVTVLANLSDGTIGVGQTVNCTFSVDNTNVATVTAGGVLKPGTNGTANLIVNLASAGLSLTNPITVLAPTALSISVAKTSLLVGNGQGDSTTATLSANYTDASGVTVNGYQFTGFTTSPAGVLTVTTNGTLAAIGVGTAQVIGTYDGLSATSAVVTVTGFTAPGTVESFAVKLTDSISTHGMTFHDLSGAPGLRFAYWNNLLMPGSPGTATYSVAPFDYHGNTLTSTLVLVTPGAQLQDSFNTIGTVTTNESTLFCNFLDVGMNNGTTVDNTLVISNVPYSSYDVYFYFYNDNGVTNRPARVVINGTTQYRNNSAFAPVQPDNNGNGYVIAAPQPPGLPASVANVPAGNVIKFSSLTDPTLNATWAAVGQDWIGDANVVTRARLVGFQVVKSLGGLTATNIYLQSAIPAQLPGNPTAYSGLTLLANFTDGTMGGNITALAGVSYASSDTGVFSVDSTGIITPGLNPGVATLTITYQTNTLNTSITNLAPTAVRVVAAPGTVYLDGALGLLTSHAAAYADFATAANVNISSFSSVSFVDQGSPVCSMATDGTITPNAVAGSANLGVSYLGTNHVSTNAFTVRSVSDAPVLVHQYLFTNAPNATVVKDTVGSADGTVFPALGTNASITFDGSCAIFPGTADYSTAPYISLKPGIINRMGDVTIELWGGQSSANVWARFYGFGNTPKGLDPHNFGGTAPADSIQMIARTPSTVPSVQGAGAGYLAGTAALINGAEYHLVAVFAPNAGTSVLYVNGVPIVTNSLAASPLYSTVNDTVDWLGVSLSNADAPLAGWMNKLAIYEGALSAAQVAANYTAGASVYFPPGYSPVATNVVPVSVTVAGGNLNLTWPPDHQGWRLEVQTNALNAGLTVSSNAWFTVPNSTTTTNVTIPINPANGAVFYRLVYP